MPYIPGDVDAHKYWRSEKGVHPPDVGTCKKYRAHVRRMRRYWAAVRQTEGGRYHHVAQRCRKDSIKLAAEMVEHSKVCNICCQERVLNEEYFYGVYPMPRKEKSKNFAGGDEPK